MESQAEKVYVAIGTDLQDGFGALEWALRRWSSHSTSVVILHATMNISKEYVYTPFGKVPARYINDDKVEDLRKFEQGIIDKYITFCGKVKAEVHKIDRHDEPIHKVTVDLISTLQITKLVLGFNFMKASSGKSKSAISGLFYIHRHKPDFCEMYIIHGRKPVSLREVNNEGFIEDDQGVLVAKVKEKISLKGFLGKMFPESATNKKAADISPSSSMINNSPDQWENNVEEIENYFNILMTSNSDEDDRGVANEIQQNSATDSDMPENMSAAEKTEALKTQIGQVQQAIQLNRGEAKTNIEKSEKAEWAICLCNHRAEELEGRINEERASQDDLSKELNSIREELYEIQSEVEEKKSKNNSILELHHELSNKLQISTLAKSHAETQLEKAVRTRAEMVEEIEELRRQRDVLQRRIEFCRDKDAIGMATRLSELGFIQKEFTAAEIIEATDDFSQRRRLKSAGEWSTVYRARIKHVTVAVKHYNSVNYVLSPEAFLAKVNLLGQVRHPNLVAMIGFCSELKCIVYEYMHHGCLRDTLFSSSRSSKRRNQGLHWHTRIHIAFQVCSGLGYLHQAQPRPIVHGNLNPSKILLDRTNIAKIHGYRLGWGNDEIDMRSDMKALGILMLQLLSGRNWGGLVEETILMDRAALLEALDQMAGEWPLDLAVKLAGIAARCLSIGKGVHNLSTMEIVMREIEKVKKKADNLVANKEFTVEIEGGSDMEGTNDIPNLFICPIFQETMKNPHVAADGFSYELEAIEEWLRTGQDTSPVTNLKLKHKLLTPNHSLRSLIQDWHNKRSASFTH